MFTGPGLRTPRGKSSDKLEVPLMEADLPVSDMDSSQMMMPPGGYDPSDAPAQAMEEPYDEDPVPEMEEPAQAVEEPQVPKKPTPQKKKIVKKKAAAARSSQEANTISLGDELLTEDFSRRDSGAGAETDSKMRAEMKALAAENEKAIDEDARRLIAKSWQELKEHEEKVKLGANKKDEDEDGPGSAAKEETKKSSGFFSRFSKKTNQEGKSSSSAKEKGDEKNNNNNNSNSRSWDVPQTFKEMTLLNAAMTSANISYIEVVESCFENLVGATVSGDFIRVEVESNIMALRIHKDVKGKLNLVEFKTCMLASLRSLLPKSWSMAHEHAWSRMWELIQKVLTKTLPLPGRYEKAVDRACDEMSDEDKKKYGLNAFNRFFAKQPQSEIHFNTSNARLSVLAMQGLQLCQDIYKEPTRLVNVVTSLGLKHIMFNISTEYFDAFVEAQCEELAEWHPGNQSAIEGVEWALTQIAAIMIYTIREGSNPLLAAVITNNQKKVRAALAPLSKKDRAATALGATSKLMTGTGSTSGPSASSGAVDDEMQDMRK